MRQAFATRAVLAATMIGGLLAGCGPSDAPKATPPAAPPRVLTAAERSAALTALPAPYNSADLENGRRVFARCRSCHTITPNGPNMTGPSLYGVIGRTAGTHEGFRYSTALSGAGFAWDAARIDHWLENPRTFLPGNKMSFPGLPDAADRRDVVAFLSVDAAKPN